MKNNFFKKLTTSAALLALSVQNQLVYAVENDPFAKTGKDITKVGNDIKKFSYTVAVACFIVAGLLFMLGDTAKQKGIKWIPGIIAGLLIIALASAAVGYFQGLGG